MSVRPSSLRGLRLPILAVVMGALLIRGPLVVEPPGRDQHLFLLEASLLLDGGTLYDDIWEHKPPGIVLVNALAVALTGTQYIGVHILNALAGLLTALGIVLLFRRHSLSALAGTGAALVYLVFQASWEFGGYWCTAQAEVFMDPLVVAALLLVPGEASGATGRGAARAGLAGGFVALAFLLKYSALPLMALGLWFLLGGSRRPSRQGLWRACFFALGAAIPVGAWMLWAWASGTLVPFWEATVEFNLLHAAAAGKPLLHNLFGRLFYSPQGALTILHIGAAVGAAFTLLPWLNARTGEGPRRLWLLGLALWLLQNVALFWQGKFWTYHYHVVLLPLCLMAGVGTYMGVMRMARFVRRPVVAAVVLCLMGLGLYPHFATQFDYVAGHRIWSRWTGQATEFELNASYVWGRSDYAYVETWKAAARAKAETTSEDSIFVWGFEPGLYVLSERRPAARFLYDYPLSRRFGPVRQEFEQILVADLNAAPPALFFVLVRDENSIEDRDSLAQLNDTPLVSAFLEEFYLPAWREGDFLAFARKSDAPRKRPVGSR